MTNVGDFQDDSFIFPRSALKKPFTKTPKRLSNRNRKLHPAFAVAILKGWLFSPEHVSHPYPTKKELNSLMQTTGLSSQQIKTWFINARRRLWKNCKNFDQFTDTSQTKSAPNFERGSEDCDRFLPKQQRMGCYDKFQKDFEYICADSVNFTSNIPKKKTLQEQSLVVWRPTQSNDYHLGNIKDQHPKHFSSNVNDSNIPLIQGCTIFPTFNKDQKQSQSFMEWPVSEDDFTILYQILTE
mmetsp:Transcript_34985/g.44926  ORF Transcript_34985/g.44926 Transcript_34985/m.44926 type:complete len:240 (-) Transcript_34985:144-863(-)